MAGKADGPKGSDDETSKPVDSDERGLAEEQAAAADQDASDRDQNDSESDQSSLQRDQIQSDIDQAASNRDQAAADLDYAEGDGGASREQAYSRSRDDRLLGTSARERTTLNRERTTLDRAKTAGSRDEAAAARDLAADRRDQVARARDRVAEKHEQNLVDVDVRAVFAAARASAAADRASAANDRARAASDREEAASDREQAVIDLKAAHLDDLTGFYLRKMGKAALQAEIDRAQRLDGRLVLAFVDVDGLKAVNESRGHAAGDAVLQQVAKALGANLRPYDPIVRVGGDEFVCALAATDLEAAERRFAGVRSDLQESGDARISVGLASLREDETLDQLMSRGDEALRDERRRGRHR